MIEIIKEGNINWRNCTCPDCKTEFRYTLSSVFRDYNSSNPYATRSGSIYRRFIDCPLCKVRIYL